MDTPEGGDGTFAAAARAACDRLEQRVAAAAEVLSATAIGIAEQLEAAACARAARVAIGTRAEESRLADVTADATRVHRTALTQAEASLRERARAIHRPSESLHMHLDALRGRLNQHAQRLAGPGGLHTDPPAAVPLGPPDLPDLVSPSGLRESTHGRGLGGCSPRPSRPSRSLSLHTPDSDAEIELPTPVATCFDEVRERIAELGDGPP